MKKPIINATAQTLTPYVMSGLLFALSWPNFPYVRLEIFAWVWMVPMLLALRSVTSFWRFLRNVYFTMLLGLAVGMSWLVTSTTLGFVLGFLIAGAVFTVPLVGFYLVRQSLGWRAALWSAPVIWTAWEWGYNQSEGSIGWLGMGLTQSNLYWLVQYADITGVWGISFWLVLFNVLVVMAIDDWQTERVIETGVQGSAFKRVVVWFEGKTRLKPELQTGFLIRRLAVIAVVMLLPPLAYSAFIFIRASDAAPDYREISVLMIQPNIDPWRKFDRTGRAGALARTTVLTDTALTKEKPDLIIWPESAVPYVLRHESGAREFVYRAVSRWNIPLLTGTLDGRDPNNAQEQSSPPDSKPQDVHSYNAAVLLTPEANQTGQALNTKIPDFQQRITVNGQTTSRWSNVKASDLYHKRALMPFAERVPFVDQFPPLSRLAIDVGGNGGFSPGNEATVFSFNNQKGEKVTVAALICYDQFYPAQIAELVENGAEMLALITNEGWFSKTHGEYQMAAFTRLRAIETRRSIARTANTGVTGFIDPLGRIYDQAPWWSEQTVIGNVRLSNELSWYVRNTDYLPKACVWLSLALAFAILLRAVPHSLFWPRPDSRKIPVVQ